MKVRNKVIVVTGGGNGIGQQIVLQLLRKKATVAAVDISHDALEHTKQLAGERAERLSLHVTDISNREAIAALKNDILAIHGCVDGIINNAGIIHPFKKIEHLDFSTIDRVINVNIHGVINMTKIFLPELLERPEAHITNVASMGGLFAFPGQSIYGATKAAVNIFSEALFVELSDTNVGVSVIYPGAINTDIMHNSGAESEKIAKLESMVKNMRGTSPVTAAKKIIEGIEEKTFSVYIGMDSKLLSAFNRVNPELNIMLLHKTMGTILTDDA